MRKTIRFPRQELFDRVWSTPLLALAKEIGIPDVALGKACRRARVPLPGRGYWAKPETRRRKITLPASKDHDQAIIEFTVLEREALPALVTKKAPEAQCAVVVDVELTNPHKLVTKEFSEAICSFHPGRKRENFSRGVLNHDLVAAITVRDPPRCAGS